MTNTIWRIFIFMTGVSCAMWADDWKQAISFLAFAISVIVMQVLLQFGFFLIDKYWPERISQ